MKAKLSLLMITKNADALLKKSLESAIELADEIVIIDGNSKNQTKEIANLFGAKIFNHDEEDLGKKREYGLKKVSGDWILVLDSDEIVSAELRKEIKMVLSSRLWGDKRMTTYGYLIPFQNHFLGRPIYYGGENYKMLRLFRKDSVFILPSLVHEGFTLKSGKTGELKNKIFHYSYRSLMQMFSKFSDYAFREARQKVANGERTDFRKIFFYPTHMFFARFIKDRGYKDGIFRLPLDIGFAYMEFLTYLRMLFIKK